MDNKNRKTRKTCDKCLKRMLGKQTFSDEQRQ